MPLFSCFAKTPDKYDHLHVGDDLISMYNASIAKFINDSALNARVEIG